MRLAPLFALLFLLTVFAGCLGGDDDKDPAGGGPNEGDGGTAPTTSAAPQGGNGPNAPPQVSLNIDAATGQAPHNVTFDIAGHDPDDETVTWTLDANGDGKKDIDGKILPFNFTYTFQTSGKYVAKLSATDGTHTVEKNVTVNVFPPPTDDVPDPITLQGKVTGVWAGSYVGDPTIVTFELDTIVNEMRASLTWDTNSIDMDYALATPDGQGAGDHATYNDPTGTVYPVYEPDIVVTDPNMLTQLGTWTFTVWGGVAVDSTFTITVQFA